ncbi:hypothetical protein FocTR4_00001126, partial [Fusarium oxysporum f. sp. cubense]
AAKLVYKQKKELSDGPGNGGLTEGSQIPVVEGTIAVTASGEVRTGWHEESLLKKSGALSEMGQVYSVKHQATSEVNQCQDETTSSKRSVGLVQGRSIEPSPSKTAYDFHNKYRTWLGQVNAGICPSSINVGEYQVSGNKGSWQTGEQSHFSFPRYRPFGILCIGNVIRAEWHALKQAAFRYLISDNKCQPTPKRERRTGEPLSPMDHPMGF